MGMEATAGEREQEQGGIQENSEKKAQCLTPQTLEEEKEEARTRNARRWFENLNSVWIGSQLFWDRMVSFGGELVVRGGRRLVETKGVLNCQNLALAWAAAGFPVDSPPFQERIVCLLRSQRGVSSFLVPPPRGKG